MAALLLRVLRSLEKWDLLQDQSGEAVNEALNLLVELQFLQGDHLVSLQTHPAARQKCLEGHRRRMDEAHKAVVACQRGLISTHADLLECARELGAVAEGAAKKRSAAAQVPVGSALQKTQKPKLPVASSSTLSAGGGNVALFQEEIAPFIAEVVDAYGDQLTLQNSLITLYRERLSPADRKEMNRILAVWMDRPCEWAVARFGRRRAVVRELKKFLRLPA
ncbi:hypothetical protein BESB_080140 [Besnoitia besnoiti]|uniref:Awp1 n=1 Tax=Besnoitia besnoiti TaxID=94643 RepID=A0A2A9M5P8_BESBE|nr:hypothetical protein BESB_080140 [Besnoitia besnoiti]PFH33798.1 hypothetical protein BESB_080140 [Besnoitia besnoiti]